MSGNCCGNRVEIVVGIVDTWLDGCFRMASTIHTDILEDTSVLDLDHCFGFGPRWQWHSGDTLTTCDMQNQSN